MCMRALLPGDAAAMRRVLAWVREALPHIQHVAHAAGVSGLAMLQDLSAAEFDAVVSTKVCVWAKHCVLQCGDGPLASGGN